MCVFLCGWFVFVFVVFVSLLMCGVLLFHIFLSCPCFVGCCWFCFVYMYFYAFYVVVVVFVFGLCLFLVCFFVNVLCGAVPLFCVILVLVVAVCFICGVVFVVF